MEDKYFKPTPESERLARQAFDELGQYTKKLNKAKEKEPISWIGLAVGIPFGIVLAAIFIFYGSFAHGFVGYKLWQWFMVPIFDLPTITICKAIGIMLLVRLFTYENPFGATDSITNPNLKMSEKATRLAGLLFGPWFSLLLGYIVKSLI